MDVDPLNAAVALNPHNRGLLGDNTRETPDPLMLPVSDPPSLFAALENVADHVPVKALPDCARVNAIAPLPL